MIKLFEARIEQKIRDYCAVVYPDGPVPADWDRRRDQRRELADRLRQDVADVLFTFVLDQKGLIEP